MTMYILLRQFPQWQKNFVRGKIWFMHKCLVYMYYQNNNISIWNRLTEEWLLEAIGGFAALQIQGKWGMSLRGGWWHRDPPLHRASQRVCFMLELVLVLGDCRGISHSGELCPSSHLAGLGALHISVFLPSGKQHGASQSTPEHLPKTPLPGVKFLIVGEEFKYKP